MSANAIREGVIDMLRRYLDTGCYTALVLAMVMVLPFSSEAAKLNLSDTPLYIRVSADPNIMFTMDDSSSMAWSVMPESLRGKVGSEAMPKSGKWQKDDSFEDWYDENDTSGDGTVKALLAHSADRNSIYYNPETRYRPWSNSDGTLWANASTACTRYNPNNPKKCQDLATQITTSDSSYTYWPATYFVYDLGGAVDGDGFPTGTDSTNPAMYTKVEVNSASAPFIKYSGRTDCAGTSCSYNEEMQNFANWFSYYRTRRNVAKAGIGKAFSAQGTDLRVGYASINHEESTVDGVEGGTVIDGVRPFSGEARIAWFKRLYDENAYGGTPLRRALDDVGKYFQRTDNPGPWGNTPGVDDPTPHAACRPTYHILMTDGYWNGSEVGTAGARENVDNIKGPKITSPTAYQYRPAAPYSDNVEDTLADVAMYYWNRDLRPDLGNYVPTSTEDIAFWQHMVNFMVGLGVVGTLDPYTTANAIAAGTDPGWSDPHPDTNRSRKIDDLWHAAVNSRGEFFSAPDPDALSAALTNTLSTIVERTSSASSVAIDSQVTRTDRTIYQAKFTTEAWTGTLKALNIDLKTGSVDSELWDAQMEVSAQNPDSGRYVATWNLDHGEGKRFRWGELTAAQNDLLHKDAAGVSDSRGEERLDFIRGVEGLNDFRDRKGKLLGDIVHSSPLFVGTPGAAHTDSAYLAFKESNKSRKSVVYVGANDGMLHALDASTGEELFAYIPNAVFKNLSKLTDKSYGKKHKYFVDGALSSQDVLVGTGSSAIWKTVLVGALRGGGKSVYALDISEPVPTGATPIEKEGDVADKVMWEFADDNLGFVYGEIPIVRMANGKWAAIVSNGYNSSGDGRARVYVIDIEDGAVIKSFVAGGGSVANPNGMSAPLPIDVNGDSIADYIYAGDLEGNVWKFDVRESDENLWGSAYTTGGVATPLFRATDESGNSQPITARMDVGRHPTKDGYMVYFGTGKYLELKDVSETGQNTQTFYGVWDRGTSTLAVFNRDHLLEQKIEYQFTATETGGLPARVVSANGINWHSDADIPDTSKSPIDTHLGWRIDFINPNTDDNDGERIVSYPQLIAGQIIFPTLLPSGEECDFGGTSWIMELDASNGGRIYGSVLDVNEDTEVDADDYVEVVMGGKKVFLPASGVKSKVGAVAEPNIVSLPGGQQQVKIISGTTGSIQSIFEDPGSVTQGRQSWIRLQ